jgi:hypothetical protein
MVSPFAGGTYCCHLMFTVTCAATGNVKTQKRKKKKYFMVA